MKNTWIVLTVFLCIIFAFPNYQVAQGSSSYEMDFQIEKIYPYLSIAEDKLTDVQTLKDLDKRFKPAWVKEFISVNLSLHTNGKIRTAINHSDTLSIEQKDLLKDAASNSIINVCIKYLPDNTLIHNDIKEHKFTLPIEPINLAQFQGGNQALKNYIQENAINKISKESIREYGIAAINFIIDERGQVIDAHISQASESTQTDSTLLKVICDMPAWKPAEYANGRKIKQELALSVGDLRSCSMNVVNPYRLLVE